MAACWIPSLRQGGASTLATQIEKFRHYPDGLTRDVEDKISQMVAASMRTYLDGPLTLGARERIVATYLNSTPLSSRTGYGEIIGLGDGLWLWFGTDLAEAGAVLSDPAPVDLERKAEIYKQVLSLLLAQRRPSYYLLDGRADLKVLADQYLRLLAAGGVIDADLKEAALAADLRFLKEPPALGPVSFISQKASGTIRTELLRLLKVPSLYDLDRLDLSVDTTFDSDTQKDISEVLANVGKRDEAKARGLTGPNLLGNEDPANVKYSVVLYEKGADRNFVRIHADSLDQPFDLNSGAKLILGSTAKFRTLVTYLDIIARLHDRYAEAPASRLAQAYGRQGRRPAHALGRGLHARRQGQEPSADPRCGHAAPLLVQSGRTLLHRRRRAHLQQLPALGQRQEPDRGRRRHHVEQSRLHPHHARHPRLLPRGRRAQRGQGRRAGRACATIT